MIFRKSAIVLLIILPISLLAKVIPVLESMRNAVEYSWSVEDSFWLGEMLSFRVVGTNISQDTAISYTLDAAEISGDSLEFVIVRPLEKYVSDTLAPGDSADYYYLHYDNVRWHYDPWKDERSYAEPVGIWCLPVGEYKLIYRRRWERADSITFSVVEPPEEERTNLDTLASLYIAFQVERYEDALKAAEWLAKNAPESPYTARGLTVGRGIAWKYDFCEQSVLFDSLLWENFGGLKNRYKYMPLPGFIKATQGVLQKCKDGEERTEYLDWIESQYSDDTMTEAIKETREVFEGK